MANSRLTLNSTTSKLWNPFKSLYTTVTDAILGKSTQAQAELELILKKHKSFFTTLLETTAKNAAHRTQLRKADTEGIHISGTAQTKLQTLDKSLIEESIILSDLFDLNELEACELLMAADRQSALYPDLTRGLIAVLLYHDGRRCLIASLRTLVQAQSGRFFLSELSTDLQKTITDFVNDLMDDGMLSKIIAQIRKLDVYSCIKKMEEQRALGKPKHRQQVIDLMNETRLSLGETIFFWSCQRSFDKDQVIDIIKYLRTVDVKKDATIDPASLAVLMSYLYSIDVSLLLTLEDADLRVQSLEMLLDADFIPSIDKHIRKKEKWENSGIEGVIHLSWSVTLRVLSQHHGVPETAGPCIEHDEDMLDKALELQVFEQLKTLVIESEGFQANDEFYLRKVHELISLLVHHMPFKVKEMRTYADEKCRVAMSRQQEGLQAQATDKSYLQTLLEMMSSVYNIEKNRYGLSEEYWLSPNPPTPTQLSLHKFIRTTAEHIPTLMFVPYLDLLSSISQSESCSIACFILLRNIGDSSSLVSWDHMFHSLNQYFTSLKQENIDAQRAGLQALNTRPVNRDIKGQELQALLAVCRLIESVATQSIEVRVTLAESQQWLAPIILFGLIGCSVPAVLKGQILKSLAALALTPEIACTLWQTMDQAQLIPLGETAAGYTGGIITELEEIESRAEDYPMLLGFLTLIDKLCESTDKPPPGLGAGYRAPGFQPYLDFIIERVLLKSFSRSYRNKAQKWEVISSVLNIVHQLVKSHEIEKEDFMDKYLEMPNGSRVQESKAPGHVILTHLLQSSPMLHTILNIVHEGLDQLSTYQFNEHVSEATRLALKLISMTLDVQDVYLECLRLSGQSTIVSRLDQLLLEINTRTGQADHLVTITRYAAMTNKLPEHVLYSAHILGIVCKLSAAQPDILCLFTTDKMIAHEIQTGLVEALEQVGEACDKKETRERTARSVLEFLLSTVQQGSQNLALYLLGFNQGRSVNKTELQAPGMLGSTRTCLHAVLTLISSDLTSTDIVALCYQLIYTLCAYTETSSPTLRYLRTAHDFFYITLTNQNFISDQSEMSETEQLLSYLKQQTWFLKSLAIELRVTSLNKQRSHTLRLLTALLDTQSYKSEGTFIIGDSHRTLNASKLNISTITTLANTSSRAGTVTQFGSRRRRLLQYLDRIPFYDRPIDDISLEQFNTARVMQVISASEEQQGDTGLILINIKQVHRVLTHEINQSLANQSVPISRDVLLQEVNAILEYCLHWNSNREEVHIRLSALESWRQVAEVIINLNEPTPNTDQTHQHNVVIEILTDVIKKCQCENSLEDLISCSSGVIFSLMSALRRHSYKDSVLKFTGSNLQVILKGILGIILTSNSALQRARANLYGSLLYYIQLSQPTSTKSIDPFETPGSVLSGVIGRQTDLEKLANETLTVIHSFGDSLLEVVIRDACDGMNVSRMLALSCLDSVISLDATSPLIINFMNSTGYLKHLLDSLTQCDEALIQSLDPSQPFRQIYIYESTMSLLTQLAMTSHGANTLLNSGLMSTLSQCAVYSCRPSAHTAYGSLPIESEGLLSSSYMCRYRQVLLPCLRLCLTVIVSLGTDNINANSQVMKFVITHGEALYSILRDTPTNISSAHQAVVDSLQDLSLLTSVLSRAAIVTPNTDGDGSEVEYTIKSQTSRIQRTLVSLLPQYLMMDDDLSDKYFKANTENDQNNNIKIKMAIYIHNIAANISCYCRNVIMNSSTPDSKYCRVLFAPHLTENLAQGDQTSLQKVLADHTSKMSQPSGPPSLGLIIIQLRLACNRLLLAIDEHKQLTSNITEPDNATQTSSAEEPSMQAEDKSKSQRAHSEGLTHIIHVLGTVVENSMYIVWRHLDFYLIHCVPENEETTLFKTHQYSQRTMRKLTALGSSTVRDQTVQSDNSPALVSPGITREQLAQLKQLVPLALNETLLHTLSDVDKVYSSKTSHFGYIAALSRRLRRLININCQ